jgi:hypothetical protein
VSSPLYRAIARDRRLRPAQPPCVARCLTWSHGPAGWIASHPVRACGSHRLLEWASPACMPFSRIARAPRAARPWFAQLTPPRRTPGMLPSTHTLNPQAHRELAQRGPLDTAAAARARGHIHTRQQRPHRGAARHRQVLGRGAQAVRGARALTHAGRRAISARPRGRRAAGRGLAGRAGV